MSPLWLSLFCLSLEPCPQVCPPVRVPVGVWCNHPQSQAETHGGTLADQTPLVCSRRLWPHHWGDGRDYVLENSSMWRTNGRMLWELYLGTGLSGNQSGTKTRKSHFGFSMGKYRGEQNQPTWCGDVIQQGKGQATQPQHCPSHSQKSSLEDPNKHTHLVILYVLYVRGEKKSYDELCVEHPLWLSYSLCSKESIYATHNREGPGGADTAFTALQRQWEARAINATHPQAFLPFQSCCCIARGLLLSTCSSETAWKDNLWHAHTEPDMCRRIPIHIQRCMCTHQISAFSIRDHQPFTTDQYVGLSSDPSINWADCKLHVYSMQHRLFSITIRVSPKVFAQCFPNITQSFLSSAWKTDIFPVRGSIAIKPGFPGFDLCSPVFSFLIIGGWKSFYTGRLYVQSQTVGGVRAHTLGCPPRLFVTMFGKGIITAAHALPLSSTLSWEARGTWFWSPN